MPTWGETDCTHARTLNRWLQKEASDFEHDPAKLAQAFTKMLAANTTHYPPIARRKGVSCGKLNIIQSRTLPGRSGSCAQHGPHEPQLPHVPTHTGDCGGRPQGEGPLLYWKPFWHLCSSCKGVLRNAGYTDWRVIQDKSGLNVARMSTLPSPICSHPKHDWHMQCNQQLSLIPLHLQILEIESSGLTPMDT